jgi:hypothetical protein
MKVGFVFVKIFFLNLFLGLFSIGFLQAELLLIERALDGSIGPVCVDKSDANRQVLYEIMCKYKWPTCLAYINKPGVFSDEEKGELKRTLFSSQPAAEERFIRRKVQEINPSYDVLFVPTGLYELFCLSEYMFEDEDFKKIRNKDDGSNGEIRDNGGLLLDWNFCQPVFRKEPDEFRKKEIQPEQVKQMSLDEYDKFNRSPIIIDAFFAVNKNFVKYLTDNELIKKNLFGGIDKKDDISDDCIAKIRICFEDLSNGIRTNERIQTSYRVKPGNLEYVDGLSKELDGGAEDKILLREIFCEYEAREKNKALLFRGLIPFNVVLPDLSGGTDFTRVKLFDLPICIDLYEDFIEKYRRGMALFREQRDGIRDGELFLPLRSISYGNSLFSGFVNDKTACAYHFFISCKLGYAVLLDKERYIFEDLAKLFFVSPFSTIVGLFMHGEVFHSRTRICDNVSLDIQREYGSAAMDIYDYGKILREVGDPVLHTIKILEYLNRDNVKFLLVRKSSYGRSIDVETLHLNQERVKNLFGTISFLMSLMSKPFKRDSVATLSLKDLSEKICVRCREYVGQARRWADRSVQEDEGPVLDAPQLIKYLNIAINTHRTRFNPKKNRKWVGGFVPRSRRVNILPSGAMSPALAKVKKRLERYIPENPYAQRLDIPEASRVFFIGDKHGSVHSLLRDLRRIQIMGYLSDDFKLINLVDGKSIYLVCLGDYHNKGRWGVETWYVLLRLLAKNPNNVILLKGDHEGDSGYEIDSLGFKDELIRKYGNTVGVELLFYFKVLCKHLPEVLFLGCNGDYAQCCHGGLELGYNPATLLDALEGVQYQSFEHPDFISSVEAVGKSYGFTQSFFSQVISENAGKVIVRPGQPDGYQIDSRALGEILARSEYRKIKVIFRGHQDSFYGCKMIPKDPETRIVGDGVRIPQGETSELVWWRRILHDACPIKLTGEGFLVSNYGPVFTLSSAPEGASYLPYGTLDYDCFGILTMGRCYEDWRFIPYETSLSSDRNGKFCVWREKFGIVTKMNDGKIRETLLIELEGDAVKVNDCLNIEWSDEIPDYNAVYALEEAERQQEYVRLQEREESMLQQASVCGNNYLTRVGID